MSKGNTWFKIKREKLKAHRSLAVHGGYKPHAENPTNADGQQVANRRDGSYSTVVTRQRAATFAPTFRLMLKDREPIPAKVTYEGYQPHGARRAITLAQSAWSMETESTLLIRA